MLPRKVLPASVPATRSISIRRSLYKLGRAESIEFEYGFTAGGVSVDRALPRASVCPSVKRMPVGSHQDLFED